MKKALKYIHEDRVFWVLIVVAIVVTLGMVKYALGAELPAHHLPNPFPTFEAADDATIHTGIFSGCGTAGGHALLADPTPGSPFLYAMNTITGRRQLLLKFEPEGETQVIYHVWLLEIQTPRTFTVIDDYDVSVMWGDDKAFEPLRKKWCEFLIPSPKPPAEKEPYNSLTGEGRV